MIKPTVGRVVWFYPPTGAVSPEFSPPAAGQPLAAIIAAVLLGQAVDIVNLTVLDAVGTPHAISMVPLVQEGHDIPEGGFYATWMPYQTGQAKKDADREHDAKQLAVAADRVSDDRRMRAGILDMALRTPGMSGHDDVLQAAVAYQDHIEGRPHSGQTAAFPASSLLPHQQRVVDEKRDLDEKLAKLGPFFETPIFRNLGEAEKQRLERQEEVMQAYSAILDERIAAF